ncbi:xanthine dehydrogenase subunit D [Saccharomonospora sp. CUA-673]|nr:xanthine dehydrogenase subunit D [Saccharomonospora sp. CUA-673]
MSPAAVDPAGTHTAAGGVGSSPTRPDGVRKVRGEFAYSSDLWHEEMLWGATLRSPHPHARITGIDISRALAVPGVYAVLTHEDVPGINRFGLEHPDQPVLAEDVVRYRGEAVAVVAADHPEIAQRAMKLIDVTYAELDPVTDAEAAVHGDTAPLHQGGNVVRHVPIRRGQVPDGADGGAVAEVVVSGRYEVGMQDQAFLGPESGMAVPDGSGGVDLYVATQWLHVDQQQIVAALGLSPEQVRLTLGGVGGAFGGREDLSMQVHACLLALHTGKPVKMVYNREESFYGHVHRHPATMYYEHGATRDGRLVYVTARIYLDGGAYASSTGAVVGNAATLGVGPYDVPGVSIDCWGTYTNNPPCGAMRGFGAVQAAFGYESQMDKLAVACGLSPAEIRRRNAMSEGTVMPTGQVVDSAAPVVELLDRLEAMPLPDPLPAAGEADVRILPGGVSNTTHGEGVVRGVGYAVGIKNICFSEGFDDYSTARVRLSVVGGEPAATVQTAAAEVGQGLVTILQQIVRTELGVEQVAILPMDTSIGSAGSTSASRQTYVTGGAVRAAALKVRSALLSRAASALGRSESDLHLDGLKVGSTEDGVLADVADVLGGDELDETVEWRHRPTESLDPETGQGNAHVQYGFAAHRAVVDVDTELGLVKVVALDCAQDVGKALNPQAVVGQIQGGSAQGLGLAVMEEIQTEGGVIRNPSFTDYLIPTVLDMPPMNIDVLELADPHAPYGLRGVGEPPTISSTPAIIAAVRAATGKDLTRAPVRPDHLI